ncbi:MAG TPA: ADP-ribosylglycohydrolase family protein [Verrucomicrobiae bacterium]|nr:ADP-ribosylglycohydrolase family protein [Verrucomicrobiae bacterium]
MLVLLRLVLPCSAVELSRDDYRDRVEAVWTAQIVAVLMNWPFEHQTASTLWLTNYPKRYTVAPVDDDWYYEMVAIRGFEKYGIKMTAEQLGEQWKENACGSWGSSEQARFNLAKGIKAPESGHPRYNRLWFTIGPQFSADVYGALAPGMVNEAARMAREYGHVNGYAEGTDGAVFMAAMVSLAFAETDTREIVRGAAHTIHPSSPYRQCLDLIISLAESGKSFSEIAAAVEDRWHIEYPATNNAVPNGGLVAAALWFGQADFLKTMNLLAGAADFTDADCNAANAAAVLGAMHGMKCLPPHLVKQLGDRIKGEKMGPVMLTPSVDERISDLARRTVAIGEKVLVARGAKLQASGIVIDPQSPTTQPPELFKLADLTQYWNSDWELDRAGFGGAGGGMGGIRGITHLDGDVLATYPRDEVRGLVLRRTLKLSEKPVLSFQAGVDSGRAWELNVYANNKLLEKRIIEGGTEGGRKWHDMKVDLRDLAGHETNLRLYQRVLVPNRVAGNAYWRNLNVE